MTATQNRPHIRYVRPIEYPWVSNVLHIVLNVIRAKPKVRDNLFIAIILSFLTTVY
jgi:hypothetical protein